MTANVVNLKEKESSFFYSSISFSIQWDDAAQSEYLALEGTNLLCFLNVYLYSGNILTYTHPSASNKSSRVTTRGLNPLLFVIGISDS